MSIKAPQTEHAVVPRPVIAMSDEAVGVAVWRDPTAVLTAIQDLTASTQPTVVLASLAAICAPAVADECWATIQEDGVTHLVGAVEPTGDGDSRAGWAVPLAGDDRLILSFEQPAWEQYPAFSGAITWRWDDRDRPTRSDKVIAQLLLDRAIELVRAQRLEAAATVARDMAANLNLALASSREIGQAIGILMSSRKVTSQQGFDLLRMASQRTHRKLHKVATEVCETGMIELPTPREGGERRPSEPAGSGPR